MNRLTAAKRRLARYRRLALKLEPGVGVVMSAGEVRVVRFESRAVASAQLSLLGPVVEVSVERRESTIGKAPPMPSHATEADWIAWEAEGWRLLYLRLRAR